MNDYAARKQKKRRNVESEKGRLTSTRGRALGDIEGKTESGGARIGDASAECVLSRFSVLLHSFSSLSLLSGCAIGERGVGERERESDGSSNSINETQKRWLHLCPPTHTHVERERVKKGKETM